jgi:hypothetical protein
MRLTNSQKNVMVDVPSAGDNTLNALNRKEVVGGLLGHAMNKVQTRASADVPVTREAASALGIPVKPRPSRGRQGYKSPAAGRN